MCYREYLRKVPMIIQCSESHGVAEATVTASDTLVMVLNDTPIHHLSSKYRYYSYSLNLK
jgi:hypothetical protein